MKLDFTQALNQPNKKYDFTFEWEPNADLFSSVPHKPVASGDINVSYQSDSEGDVVMVVEIRIPFEFCCDKCGSWFKKNLYITTEEKVKALESEDYYSYDSNNEVELDEIIQEIILSSFPQRVLCKPNCKGLCPTCGINLNHETCDCDDKKIGKNNPFGQLLGKI